VRPVWTPVLVAVLLSTGCLDSPSPDRLYFEGTDLDSAAAADFTLLDQDNHSLTLSDLRGKVVLLTFVYTDCPEVCPILSTLLRQVTVQLGTDYPAQVAVLSVTVNPEGDTPQHLRKYMDERDLDWPHLTGDREQLRQVWAAYGIAVEPSPPGGEGNRSSGRDGATSGRHHGGGANGTAVQEIDHSVATYILDQQLRRRVLFSGNAWDPADVTSDVRLLLAR